MTARDPGIELETVSAFFYTKSLRYAALGTSCTLTAVPRSTQPSTLRGTVNEHQPHFVITGQPSCKREPKISTSSGDGTNLKVGGLVRRESGAKSRKEILVVLLHFLALRAQLVVLVSAFVMVSTVWSVSICCSSTHGALRAQPLVKVPYGVCASVSFIVQ